MRMESQIKPYLVYFYPYEDDRFFEKSKKPQDHVCCVMASSQKEAMAKTEIIAHNNGVKFVKFMGIGTGKEEWVNEHEPLRDYGRGPRK